MKFSLRIPFGLLALCAFIAFHVRAAENAAGTWKWTFNTQNGDAIESLLILAQDVDTLTGTLSNRFGKTEIKDGQVKDNQVTFNIKREVNGSEFSVKYFGKLQGDKITGKSQFDRNGQVREREWEAKRELAKPRTANAAGTWNTALILPDGNRIESALKLKTNAEQVTGVVTRNENETPIQDGKLAGDEISFKVLREREGRSVTAKYKGKITGNSMKGKVESDWSGDWQTLDWEATRAK